MSVKRNLQVSSYALHIFMVASLLAGLLFSVSPALSGQAAAESDVSQPPYSPPELMSPPEEDAELPHSQQPMSVTGYREPSNATGTSLDPYSATLNQSPDPKDIEDLEPAPLSHGGMGVGRDTETGIQSLPSGITIDLTNNAVMGWVNPGEVVTVAVDAIGYGTAQADGVGFFWTPIWHVTDGYRIDIHCSMEFQISVEGSLLATVAPTCLNGGVDMFGDTIEGALVGDTGGTPITATLANLDLLYGNISLQTGAPSGTDTTAVDGSFSISLSGVDLGAESIAVIDREVATGITVREHIYPADPVFIIHQFSQIAGYAQPGQQIDATVTAGDGSGIRWQETMNADGNTGIYIFYNVPIERGDTVSVSLDEGPTLTATAANLGGFSFDASTDTMTGKVDEGIDVRATLWQLEGMIQKYHEFHTTGQTGGGFAINFSPTDLQARDEVLVSIQDVNGNQTQITSGPPFIGVLRDYLNEWGCILGRLDEPDLLVLYELQTPETLYTRDVDFRTDAGNEVQRACVTLRDAENNRVTFNPGDVAAMSSEGAHRVSLEIIDTSWSADTVLDELSASVPDGKVVIGARQWLGTYYPANGSAGQQLDAVGGFSAAFPDFDIRDSGSFWLDHYDPATGFVNEYSSYEPSMLPYFELQLSDNIVTGLVSHPNEWVKADLYDGGTLLASTDVDENDHSYYFRFSDFDGVDFLPGYRMVVSTADWSKEMIIPNLTLSADPDLDSITASGPDSLLWLDVQGLSTYNGTFIPGPDAFLDTNDLWGLDLQQGDTIAVVYQAVDGNRATRTLRLWEISYVGYWLNEYNLDGIWGNAVPGLPVVLQVNGGSPLSTVYNDPNCLECWNIEDPSVLALSPGDVISVTGGDGHYPVEFAIPTPFTAEADSETDVVSGQVGGRIEDSIEVLGWWMDGGQVVQTDSAGNFSASYSSIPPKAQGHVWFTTQEDGANIDNNRYFKADLFDLMLEVNFSHDWIQGEYLPGHTVELTLTESDGVTVIATATVESQIIPEWGDWTGFSTGYDNSVWGEGGRPDIEPGDWVFASVDGGLYATSVRVGNITGEVDLDLNSITGMLDVPWLDQETEVEVWCRAWGSNGSAADKVVYVLPTGTDPYTCDWQGEWDIKPGQDVAVSYVTDVGHQIYGVFQGYSDELFLNINYDHDWIEGSYKPGYYVTLTVKDSEMVEKGTTTILTRSWENWGGQSAFSTNMPEVTWDPERPNIQPGDWVFGEVTVDEVTYTAQVQIGTIKAEIDLEADSITGTLDASWLDPFTAVEIECHAWGAPEGTQNKRATVLPDDIDTFTCSWDPETEWDIAPYQQLAVSYLDPAGHWIYGVFQGYTDELILRIHYDHEWIEGNYEPGHTISLEVRDSADALKATIELETGLVDWWGGVSGFSTNQDGAIWNPRQPDLEPGDTVHGEVDDGSEFQADVLIGEITGDVDVDGNSISGTVDANWLLPGPVAVRCEIWVNNGPSGRDTSVVPDGVETYTCSWDDWDLLPGEQVHVSYFEPDGHQIFQESHGPAPYLKIEKWLEGNQPGEGANAMFTIQFKNEGDAPAENVLITDTMTGLTYLSDTSGFTHQGSGSQVIFELGTVDPGDWTQFNVFVHVDALENEEVVNTAEISTSNAYDMGEDWEKTQTWSGTVAANDIHLRIDKNTWTGNPAPNEPFVYSMNVCNNGSTGSASVLFEDHLPNEVTYLSWWAREAGWSFVDFTDNVLTLERLTIPNNHCSEVLVKTRLNGTVAPGTEVINTAEITSVFDKEVEDNISTISIRAGDPYTDLSINTEFNNGSLVPGGEYYYKLNFRNEGNKSVEGPIAVTTTIPEGTLFVGWREWNWTGVSEPVQNGNQITWYGDGLEPGFNGEIQVTLQIATTTTPGTALHHEATVAEQVGENNTDNNHSMFDEEVFGNGPNLRIRKVGDWHGYGEGHNAWFNLKIENVGDQTVMGVVVTDHYPIGMELDGEVYVQYWQEWHWFDDDPEEHAFSIYFERMEPGWSVNANYNLVIPGDEPVAWGLVFENLAEVTLPPGDSNPEDNEAGYSLGTGPDLFIDKYHEEGEYTPGQEVTFRLSFGNAQSGHTWWWNTLGSGIVTDTLPAGMTYVEGSAHIHWCGEEGEWCQADPSVTGQELRWNIGGVPTGAYNDIVFTVEIDENVMDGSELLNIAGISSDNASDLDPFPSNNTSTYQETVRAALHFYLPIILR